ncbi:MAG: nitrite reductase [Brumimicrobium sp.]|nr:nitrite reductase [Brumimicrobium sp.]
MRSFRTEIENPVVEKDIIELERKIRLFREGRIDEDRFRSLRLARGVYGQRQSGVQMIRIKLPFGRVNGRQLIRIAAVSDKYSNGNLHITTRQDIQIHYVSLDRTPELWEELERDEITLREACGNTVRNVTASETAGIDIHEPFDVSPYAEGVFSYFLRNPVCQEMGRKFKIAFSSSDKDTALSYIHDLGFIPKIKDGKKGFKVLIGGGLGSQPRHADIAYEFLPVNEIIPFTESVLRIFDRHGERARRLKARMKFLFNDIGLEKFRELVEGERTALPNKYVEISTSEYDEDIYLPEFDHLSVIGEADLENKTAYQFWKRSNVIRQKQPGLFAIGVKVQLGNFSSDQARRLAQLIHDFSGDEVRFTLRQNLLIRHVREELLPHFYNELRKIGLADPGYNGLSDITACPGTDTCNLGIAGSTGVAKALEDLLRNEYPQYLNNNELTIKISGCMNSCGQHSMAHIGFQGMTLNIGKNVAPALQVLLGGGVVGDGKGRFADKVIKIPSKRAKLALRAILDDFESNGKNESFLDYYDRQGKIYFYDLLKPISGSDDLAPDEFVDWGHDKPFEKAVGVGECAGVIIDLVATLFSESEEKILDAEAAYQEDKWADSIYHSYSSMINTAKALLLTVNKQTNTQAGIVSEFDEHFSNESSLQKKGSFSELVYQINKVPPGDEFAQSYLRDAKEFYTRVKLFRETQLTKLKS